MIGKKKIALCLSGEPRGTMLCFPYIYESFIASVKDIFEVDVYIHSLKGFRALPLYNPKNYLLENINEFEVFKKFINEVNIDLLDSRPTPLMNTLFMFYGISKCFNLTKNHQYDYYIRCRPDIMFHSKVPLHHIINKLEDSKKDIFIHHEYGTNNKLNDMVISDQFAIGNYKASKVYSEAFNFLKELIKETKSVWPEFLLGTYLQKQNLQIEKGWLDYSLIRNYNIISHPPRPNYYEN